MVTDEKDIELSQDQESGMLRIERWYERLEDVRQKNYVWLNQEPQQMMNLGMIDTLAGLAGTGKTTIISMLQKRLNLNNPPQFLAPTGKAAQVMRNKGVTNAETIHSFIYQFLGLSRDNKKDTAVPIFENREGGVSTNAPFLVVDEASMVNFWIYDDLMSHGIPTLFVGDHGQLPPVGGDPGIMREPGYALERIHRQAEGNPIIRLAHHVRDAGTPYGFNKEPGDDRVSSMRRGSFHRIAEYAIENEMDQIICGFNKNRTAINRCYREILKHEGILETGDKIICLKNDRRNGFFNGMMYRVDRIHSNNGKTITADLTDLDTGRVRTYVEIATGGFDREKPYDIELAIENGEAEKGSQVFDYGYAITGHKSQGSQWPSVLVLWDQCKFWSMARWGYTAITRAQDRVRVAV